MGLPEWWWAYKVTGFRTTEGCCCVRRRFPSLSHGMFLRGPIELVEYYLDKCNTAVG